jgi:hypothetical protein
VMARAALAMYPGVLRNGIHDRGKVRSSP